ncbi:Uncharacterised protein [Starkeya nomas]|uniref:Uncharacterized protein n=1 Tax=Starkeya nomas TaxID=2666134 RepID=A0A5S9R4J2_9HYPH|nr:Uncharacterised protein [Starkeya nomas]
MWPLICSSRYAVIRAAISSRSWPFSDCDTALEIDAPRLAARTVWGSNATTGSEGSQPSRSS